MSATEQEKSLGNILYGQIFEVNVSGWAGYICTVNGKIKDIAAYVVEMRCGKYDRSLNRIPNRQLELEWGHFSGKECEAILLESEFGKRL